MQIVIRFLMSVCKVTPNIWGSVFENQKISKTLTFVI